MGVASFMDGGFGSSGVMLIMFSNLVAVTALSKKRSIIIALTSAVIFLMLYLYSKIFYHVQVVHMTNVLWSVKFLIFVLYLITLHIVVYAIREYLLENIGELEDSVEKTYLLAYYDTLTDLPNENKLLIDLNALVNSETIGYLVVFSVKNLDVINSIYSDDIGNQVLVKIARIFKDTKEEGELFARNGGNEFVLWLDCDNQRAFDMRIAMFLNDFYKAFNMPHMTKRVEFDIGYTKHLKNVAIEATLHKSKLALTYVKTQNDISRCAYDKRLEDLLIAEETLKERLEAALEADGFSMHYQTKLDAKTQRVIGVEALARLTDGRQEMVPPDVFIPKIETMNYTIRFGEYIIKRVLKEYKLLCSKYQEGMTVAINISPAHLISDGFVDFVRHEVIQNDVSPHKILFEITEEVMISNYNTVTRVLKELKMIGFRVSLDDFGSGYSSLGYLAKLDIDELKIDKVFIAEMSESDRMGKMVEMIMEMAREYDLNVVAEGIEEEDQYRRLLELGCHEVQGFYFSRPEPLVIKKPL
jgi:EAL domain-containing protein (putative c-di-GMP-specific phosphodiesterase class I)/GGDEF domain-containing protein